MVGELYYDLRPPAWYSTLGKLRRAAKQTGVKKHTASKRKAWLEKQDSYTLHRPVRKHFPRNPCTVNNVMDVWECDLEDVQQSADMILITNLIIHITYLSNKLVSNISGEN